MSTKSHLWRLISVVIMLALLVPGLTGFGAPIENSIDLDAELITVTGKVVFDTGGPVQGAKIVGRTDPPVKIYLPVVMLATIPSTSDDVPAVHTSDRVSNEHETVTDANGNFTLLVGPNWLGIRVLVEVSYSESSMPVVNSGKWSTSTGDMLDMETIIIPDPRWAEIVLEGGSGQNQDGSLEVENMPGEVDRLFGRTYDPDEIPEAFPGEFATNGTIPLDSSVFAWMEALDASGDPVDVLSQPATIRTRVPPSQWPDLVDMEVGTGRLEVPIFTYNEITDQWGWQGIGWLEEEYGYVLPEETQSLILDGTFSGEIFAVSEASHLSWTNIDYPYIGPWDLSRLDADKLYNECLFEALYLADTIVKSESGRAAFAKFNLPGADLDVELADGAGPSIVNSSLVEDIGLTPYFGNYRGNEDRDLDGQFYLMDELWNGCGSGATKAQKKNTTFMMTIAILNLTARWKWDTKHEAGYWGRPEPGGNAGNQLETDLLGGLVGQQGKIGGGGRILLNGKPVDDSTLDWWLSPVYWPEPSSENRILVLDNLDTPQDTSPLQVKIALNRSDYALGEEIPVTLEFKNISSQPLRVLNLGLLEGMPLWFEIYRQGETARVPFRGPRAKYYIDYDQHFTTLDPGDTLQQAVNLLFDDNGGRLYNFIQSGDYSMTAFYSEHWGLPQSTSNEVSFTLEPGGSISGRVAESVINTPIYTATVTAQQDGYPIDTVKTDVNGDYTFPELPSGTYTLIVQHPGYFNATQENVQVVVEQNTVVDFNLALLKFGWLFETVDQDGDVGLQSDIALDSAGRPHISYYAANGDLKYAHYDGSIWITELVDSTGNDVAFYYVTSLALDSSDRPHISYSGYEDMRYAWHDGSDWITETVDTCYFGCSPSLALDSDDHPHIAFNPMLVLKYLWHDGSTWNEGPLSGSSLFAFPIEPDWAVGAPSLVLDSADRPHLSYYTEKEVDSKLMYAWHNGTIWQILTVETADLVGYDNSLALDSADQPHISYNDASGTNFSGDLKYATYDGSTWDIQDVDSDEVEDVGGCSSLALDSAGHPHIIYYDGDNRALKYAKYNGTIWGIQTVDGEEYDVGCGSLVLDSAAQPHLSYYDITKGDLKYGR